MSDSISSSHTTSLGISSNTSCAALSHTAGALETICLACAIAPSLRGISSNLRHGGPLITRGARVLDTEHGTPMSSRRNSVSNWARHLNPQIEENPSILPPPPRTPNLQPPAPSEYQLGRRTHARRHGATQGDQPGHRIPPSPSPRK
jgi:hypothetical protein